MTTKTPAGNDYALVISPEANNLKHDFGKFGTMTLSNLHNQFIKLHSSLFKHLPTFECNQMVQRKYFQ